ncbi:MAG: hypothetical protein RLO12_23595 [Fulvivirga sp.]
MSKRLIIHIGTHKTGTSSLQRLTTDVASQLLQEGISVIDYLKIPNRQDFIKEVKVEEKYINDLRAFLNNEIQISKKSNVFVLIWEGFSGNPRTNYSNRVPVLEMLYKSISSTVKLELVVFFRRQDQFIQSLFTQFKQEKDFSQSEQILKPFYHEGFDWHLYHDQLTKIFKNVPIHCFPYDSNFLIVKPIDKILDEILGSSTLQESNANKVVNVGMSPIALNLFEKISLKLNKQEAKYLRNLLQTKFNKGLLSDYSYLTNKDIKEWVELYRESNQKLIQSIWSHFKTYQPFTYGLESKTENADKIEEEIIIHLIREIEKLRLENSITLIQKLKQKVKRIIS